MKLFIAPPHESVVMWRSQTEKQSASAELWAALPPQLQPLQLWTQGIKQEHHTLNHKQTQATQ